MAEQTQTLAILLGASSFPHYPDFAANPAFLNSKRDFRAYLQDAESGLGLADEAILDLFDSHHQASQLLLTIGKFLKSCQGQGGTGKDAINNLLVYYVGHGFFAGQSHEYALALSGLVKDFEMATGLPLAALADLLKEHGRNFRRFVLLDCCFAAEALREFQGAAEDALVRKASAAFEEDTPKRPLEVPRQGTTLFCAADKDSVAISPQSLQRTMFSDALLNVLQKGDPARAGDLTLVDIRDLTWEQLRGQHQKPVRPALHSPDQSQGDIAQLVPLFPNPGYREAKAKAEEAAIKNNKLNSEKDSVGDERTVSVGGQGGNTKELVENLSPNNQIDAQNHLQEPKFGSSVGSAEGLALEEAIKALQSSKAIKTTDSKSTQGKTKALRDVAVGLALVLGVIGVGSGPHLGRIEDRKPLIFSDPFLSGGGYGPTMVEIPSGIFKMGSPDSEDGRDPNEGPQRDITLARFALAQKEVTVAEFRRFVQATGYKTDAEKNAGGNSGCWNDGNGNWGYKAGFFWAKPGFEQGGDHPVTCVSWNDAQAYVRWLAEVTGQPYRLPSEAQWEYAARAKSNTARPWGESPDKACQYGNVADQTQSPEGRTWDVQHACRDGYWYTAPVGKFAPNAFQLYDMIGNVSEWVQDRYHDSYKEGPPRDASPWESGTNVMRVLRGGSWYGGPQVARSADRSWLAPTNRSYNSGFRLARMLP